MPMHNWNKVIAGVFHDMHLGWINAISNALKNEVLPSTHYALIERATDPPVLNYPATKDSFAKRSDTRGLTMPGRLLCSESAIAVEASPGDEVTEYAERASRVTVYQSSDDVAVAYVEIVSPGNKHSHFQFEKFLDKLEDALKRGIHLLVIDPHPPGPRDPRGIHAAFWERRTGSAHGVTEEQPLGLSAYRSDIHPTAYFEPFAVGDTLPDMPLFLTPDHYVNCLLESTYTAAWKGVPQRWKAVIESEGERGA